MSRSSSSTGSNKPVPTGKEKGVEAEDAEGTAGEERPRLRNKKNVDYKAAPPVRQIQAGSPPKSSKQLGKRVPAKTALKCRGRGDKVPNAAEAQSNSN